MRHKGFCEGVYVALQMRTAIPPEAREAFQIIESGCTVTMTELDSMPQRLVDQLIAYRSVKHVIQYGGEIYA